MLGKPIAVDKRLIVVRWTGRPVGDPVAPDRAERRLGGLPHRQVLPGAPQTVVVHHRDVGDESGPQPLAFDPHRVVDILEVRRVVPAIEATAGDVLGPADDPASRRRVVDVAAERLRPVAGHHLRPSDGCGAGVVVEELAGFLERAVRVGEHRCGDPDHRVVEGREQRLEPTLADDHVGVQEAEVGRRWRARRRARCLRRSRGSRRPDDRDVVPIAEHFGRVGRSSAVGLSTTITSCGIGVWLRIASRASDDDRTGAVRDDDDRDERRLRSGWQRTVAGGRHAAGAYGQVRAGR